MIGKTSINRRPRLVRVPCGRRKLGYCRFASFPIKIDPNYTPQTGRAKDFQLNPVSLQKPAFLFTMKPQKRLISRFMTLLNTVYHIRQYSIVQQYIRKHEKFGPSVQYTDLPMTLPMNIG